jgi:hypothetical protein
MSALIPGRVSSIVVSGSLSGAAWIWGRDELSAGEMWNSNSVTAWLVARAGLDADTILPPTGGRAPGWNAGLLVARRHQVQARQRKPQRARRTATLTRAG